MTQERAIELVVQELIYATNAHAPMRSAHEGYAVIKEEVDELWEAIRRVRNVQDTRQNKPLRKEATQVAAMAIRFLIDLNL